MYLNIIPPDCPGHPPSDLRKVTEVIKTILNKITVVTGVTVNTLHSK